jgi:hypothetical protein
MVAHEAFGGDRGTLLMISQEMQDKRFPPETSNQRK